MTLELHILIFVDFSGEKSGKIFTFPKKNKNCIKLIH